MEASFKRTNIHGGAKFEDVAGYARIAVADPFVFVSGTTAVTPEGTVYGEGDAYAQAKYIFDKLVKLLADNGISTEEVVKVNIWTTDVSKNMDITKAYSEYFKQYRPACSWIGVAALNRPSQIVEIEMQAIKGAKITVE
jgi:enamine deaminase RidA (YjgF/YER057c/UK114 family)